MLFREIYFLFPNKMFRKKNASKKNIKRSPMRRKASKRVSPALRSTIRKIVRGTCEKKRYSNTGSSQLTFENGVSSTVYSPCVPVIAQGTGQGDRIGNLITVTNAKLDIILSANGQNTALSPCLVRFIIFSEKQEMTNTPSIQNFWQSGNTAVNPTSVPDLVEFMRKVNTDLYMVAYDRTYKVGGSTSSFTTTFNNDFKVINKFSVNLTKQLRKTTFSDAVNTSSSRQWYILPIVQYADRNTFVAGSASPVHMSLLFDMSFIDP